MTQITERCGYVAIIGRPNVGKSTLLNKILGQKISITTRKPQTTRQRILGIKTTAQAQAVYMDTPGVHEGVKKRLNQQMNRAAMTSLAEVDVIVFVVEDLKWTDEDEFVFQQVQQQSVPFIVAVNKVDQVADKAKLLPHLQFLHQKTSSECIVPISARRGNNVEQLEKEVINRLPHAEKIFSEDQITDRSMRFMAGEIIREKLMRCLAKELPYSIAVEIEKFEEIKQRINISAIIWLDRKGQKAIVIGKQGQVLKDVGQKARIDIEKLCDQKVFLQLWVKVKEGWADNARFLQNQGIGKE